jgi:hypothetical protein
MRRIQTDEGHEEPPIVTHGAHSGLAQEWVLKSAVEKLVYSGGIAGITPDDMIALLNSGLQVRELFDYVVSKTARAA